MAMAVGLALMPAKVAGQAPGGLQAESGTEAAAENAGAMGWSLDEEEVARLEEVADRANG